MSEIGDVKFDFTERVVLVTGGGSGIGREVAAAFAGAGAAVVIAGRSKTRLDEALQSMPGGVSAVQADVSQRTEVEALVAAVVTEHGKLDIVVSNAASYVPGDITGIAPGDWETLRSANIDGFFHLAQISLPYLAQTGGSLIATSSVSGIGGDWGSAIYNASKGAVSLFVKSLALDWGGRGVRVNAVAPSVTRTEPTFGVFDNAGVRALFEARVPLGRLAETTDIAPVFLFLASDAARYVTGVVLPVDGGTSASNGQARPPVAG